MHDATYLARMVIKLAFGLVGLAFRILGWVLKTAFGLFVRRMAEFDGRLRVIDGDSLAVMHEGREIKIRLFGIDAPEYDQPEGPDATRTLRALVSGQDARILPKSRDRYGRLVARVVLPDGTDVGREMVRRGMALADFRYSSAYSTEQHHAQCGRAGFWDSGGIVDPAEWRQARRG